MKAFLLTILFGAGLLPAATMYSVVDLGGLGGGSSIAYHINNAGVVVGWSQTPLQDIHAFGGQAGSMHDMNQASASNSFAYGSNGSGEIVGTSYIDGLGHGSIWNGSAFTDLGAGTFAMSVNASGEVAGGNGHAFIYDKGVFTDLGTAAGGSWSQAYGINDSGAVAGYASTANGFRAFTWTSETGLTALGTLGGNDSYAMAINNTGQVAGHSAVASGYVHAFIANNGVLTDLGTLGGNSYAYGINNAGAVVGYSGDSAFLYRNGSLMDLNSLVAANSGWQLEQAYGINDSGKIVGTGLFQGRSHAFELDPINRFGSVSPSTAAVPEPGTVTLFALGLTLLGVGQAFRILKTRRAAIRAKHNL